jgi:hypothetical protein
MATKPDLLTWVPSDDSAKITDPGATKKANGFVYLEKPAFQFINYLFNAIFKWARGLQGNYSQVVVGSAAQKSAFSATHIVTDLNNTVVPAGTRVTFLEGTHTLTANILLTSADCVFEMENAAAQIDLANTYKFGMNGARASGTVRFVNVPAAVDAIQSTDVGSRVTIIGGTAATVTANLIITLLAGGALNAAAARAILQACQIGANDSFASTTIMPFYQSAAPNYWTRLTTQNDKAMRVVSGAGGGSGGAVPFSTITSQNVAGHAISIAEMPAHTHTEYGTLSVFGGYGGSSQIPSATIGNTGSTGGGGSHNHSIGFQPAYIDLILCSKD